MASHNFSKKASVSQLKKKGVTKTLLVKLTIIKRVDFGEKNISLHVVVYSQRPLPMKF